MTGTMRRPGRVRRVAVASLMGTMACMPSDGGVGASVEAPPTVAVIDSTARAPAGTRVRLEVLNAGGVSGLARRATLTLRDAGWDVVTYGTSADTSATTRIRVTARTRAWGERVQRALGVGRLEEVEALRYADVVVLLGSDWTPTSEPLRP